MAVSFLDGSTACPCEAAANPAAVVKTASSKTVPELARATTKIGHTFPRENTMARSPPPTSPAKFFGSQPPVSGPASRTGAVQLAPPSGDEMKLAFRAQVDGIQFATG